MPSDLLQGCCTSGEPTKIAMWTFGLLETAWREEGSSSFPCAGVPSRTGGAVTILYIKMWLQNGTPSPLQTQGLSSGGSSITLIDSVLLDYCFWWWKMAGVLFEPFLVHSYNSVGISHVKLMSSPKVKSSTRPDPNVFFTGFLLSGIWHTHETKRSQAVVYRQCGF